MNLPTEFFLVVLKNVHGDQKISAHFARKKVLILILQLLGDKENERVFWNPGVNLEERIPTTCVINHVNSIEFVHETIMRFSKFSTCLLGTILVFPKVPKTIFPPFKHSNRRVL